ncbi:SDR family oxidoreductase [Pedobacter xixiisoli]|uniref:Short-chain dehydrogenase n=1 Tax=Pedobacter xixiisoli TaxID=1476464 RepID=A0A286AA53_9SPHI|nr:SDR family oxidoreductase [Pedobacter xixiisoli]SOD18752.1 Short-chain dehydrogenase [Pedobacter xixiisoli]
MKAVITGVTKGIGKATAVALAKSGYDIIGCARNEAELASFESEISSYGVNVMAIKADCSKKEEVLTFIKKAISFATEINVLVNNVGVFYPGSLLDEEDDVFETQQQININATYYIAKRIGKLMRTQGFGHIFNVCSVASKAPVENAGSYSVTKAAMLSLNYVLRRELTPYHVKVTAIIPGSTFTASWEGTTLEQTKFVQPEDIAKSITTILSLSDGANVDEVTITPSNF